MPSEPLPKPPKEKNKEKKEKWDDPGYVPGDAARGLLEILAREAPPHARNQPGAPKKGGRRKTRRSRKHKRRASKRHH